MFRVIHGVLLNERGSPAHACLYFGILGAAILRAHHRMNARAVVGAAGYNLSAAGEPPLVFANEVGEASREVFHCWVEADGWAFDFQAPIFREAVASRKGASTLPRFMVQKPLSMAASFSGLATPGAYWYGQNKELTSELLAHTYEKASTADFEKICIDWYKPLPKRMQPAIRIGNQHGAVDDVPLSGISIVGAW